MQFEQRLAEVGLDYAKVLAASGEDRERFIADPTLDIKRLLETKGVAIPGDEAEFHAHAIDAGDPLPSEPERASWERYIYIFRRDSLFEFKVVPGESGKDDEFMRSPRGACQCCNCCVFEV